MRKTFDVLINKYENKTSFPLDNLTPFSFLCLSLLSHRTKDIIILKLTNYFSKINLPQDILNKSFIELYENIKICNYSYKKTKIIFIVAKYIKDNFLKTPVDYKSLLTIPFVGEKTSSLVSSSFSKFEHVVIDTHIDRFLNRYFEKKLTYQEKSNKIKNLTSKSNWFRISNSVLGFSKTICVKKPKCNLCVLRKNCSFYNFTNI